VPESRAEFPGGLTLRPAHDHRSAWLPNCRDHRRPRLGWGSVWIVALFAVAILAGMALVVLESRRREPMIDMRISVVCRSRPRR